MRLLRLRVRGFKRLRDIELDLDYDRILVAGNNEAGKSTLVEAIQAGLYGLAPQRRGAGHTAALRPVLPWDGTPAGLSLTYRLDDGREVECDWDLSGERTTVIDRQRGEDLTARFEAGSHGWIDCGAGLLRLPASVFTQLTSVGEGQLATLSDDAEIRQGLLRLADSGVDVLVEQAIARLQEGARQATVPRVTAATRRNALGRELAEVETELARAVAARQELEQEVAAIAVTKAELERSTERLGRLTTLREARDLERERLRREVDRAEGRLAEAELRLAALNPGAEAEPPSWSDADLEAGRALLAQPLQRQRQVAATWPGILIIAVAGVILVLSLLDSNLPLTGASLVILAIGVYALTQSHVGPAPQLRVGDRAFANPRLLMDAVDQERARRERETQQAAVTDLRARYEALRQTDGTGSGEDLDAEYHAVGRAHQELNLRLEGQRAALERGASHVPEVAPLEERAVELRRRIERLEAFGAACALAASTLEMASAELRRTYAPRLQAYLSAAIARVTGGRYSEALVSETFDVLLRAPETGSMVNLHRLSRGTQQQVYLLLRLALLDAMGEGSERLPLVLDDALALADDPRRVELLRVLEGERRQVIYLAAAEGGPDALFGPEWHRVVLPAPPARPPAASEHEDGAAGQVGLVASGLEPGPG